MPFNIIRTVEIRSSANEYIFATVIQMFGGTSQLPSTAAHRFVAFQTVLNDLITMRSVVVGSWEEPPNI